MFCEFFPSLDDRVHAHGTFPLLVFYSVPIFVLNPFPFLDYLGFCEPPQPRILLLLPIVLNNYIGPCYCSNVLKLKRLILRLTDSLFPFPIKPSAYAGLRITRESLRTKGVHMSHKYHQTRTFTTLI